jgi:translation initiation factor 6
MVLLLKKMDISGNPFIGVYCHANEDFALVPKEFSKKMISSLEECLGVEVFQTTVASSSLIGVLVASNSNGMVVTNFAERNELREVAGRRNILFIPDVLNAAGNNILCNDRFALLHPGLKKTTIKKIEDVLDVEVDLGSIAELNTVGAACIVTKGGLLSHPHTSEEELEILKKRFGVEGNIGTANYGTPLVGACMIANSRGAIVGSSTTPIELGRIEDALLL